MPDRILTFDVRQVFVAVSGWRKVGRRLRLKSSMLDAYASFFENPLMLEARGLRAK
jgi:hypothetical protein